MHGRRAKNQTPKRRTKAQREWWGKYDAYLQSPEWRSRRQLVMERAGWICEGCRTRPAEQVHHLTYSHVFDELLFQLVALCEPCHNKAHGHEPKAVAPTFIQAVPERPLVDPKEGGRVQHAKFGSGSILKIVDQNKCEVDFDRMGRKIVINDYLATAP